MSRSALGFGRYVLDPDRRRLIRGDEVVELTTRAFDLLLLLLDNRHRVVGKDEILRSVWAGRVVEEANLSQTVYTLRRLLAAGGEGVEHIRTVARIGYRFVAPVELRGPPLEIRRAQIEVIHPEVQPARGPVRSLAVLPLAHAAGDASLEYMADGITESLIGNLCRLPGLLVRARASSFRYKGRTPEPIQIGRELSVDAVLVGRLCKSPECLRVDLELMDARDGWRIWSGQYDRDPAAVGELQVAIVQEVARQLQVPLSAQEEGRLSRRLNPQPEALDLYMQGRHYLNKRLPEPLRMATEFFRAAAGADTDFALAHVGLSDAYSLLSLYGGVRGPAETFAKARSAALQALKLDNGLAEAHTSLGVVKLWFDWDWEGAEQAFREAIRLNPDYADAHFRYGILLVARGRFDEAAEQFAIAQDLDPLSLIISTISAYADYYAGRFDAAALRYRRTLEKDADFSMAHFRLGLALAQTGDLDGARAELERAEVLSKREKDVVAALGYLHGRAGRAELARAALAELNERSQSEYTSGYNFAIVHAGLGETEAACEWLERALAERSYWLIYAERDPLLDSLRDSARFKRIMTGIAKL